MDSRKTPSTSSGKGKGKRVKNPKQPSSKKIKVEQKPDIATLVTSTVAQTIEQNDDTAALLLIANIKRERQDEEELIPSPPAALEETAATLEALERRSLPAQPANAEPVASATDEATSSTIAVPTVMNEVVEEETTYSMQLKENQNAWALFFDITRHMPVTEEAFIKKYEKEINSNKHFIQLIFVLTDSPAPLPSSDVMRLLKNHEKFKNINGIKFATSEPRIEGVKEWGAFLHDTWPSASIHFDKLPTTTFLEHIHDEKDSNNKRIYCYSGGPLPENVFSAFLENDIPPSYKFFAAYINNEEMFNAMLSGNHQFEKVGICIKNLNSFKITPARLAPNLKEIVFDSVPRRIDFIKANLAALPTIENLKTLLVNGETFVTRAQRLQESFILTNETTEEDIKSISPQTINIDIEITRNDKLPLLKQLPKTIANARLRVHTNQPQLLLEIIDILPLDIKGLYLLHSVLPLIQDKLLEKFKLHHQAGGVSNVMVNKAWPQLKTLSTYGLTVNILNEDRKSWTTYSPPQPPASPAISATPPVAPQPASSPAPTSTEPLSSRYNRGNFWSLHFYISKSMPKTRKEFRDLYAKELNSKNKFFDIKFIFVDHQQAPTAEVIEELKKIRSVQSIIFEGRSERIDGDETWQRVFAKWTVFSVTFNTLPSKNFLQHIKIINAQVQHLQLTIGKLSKIDVNSEAFISFIENDLPPEFQHLSIGPSVEEKVFNVLISGKHKLKEICFNDTEQLKDFRLKTPVIARNLTSIFFSLLRAITGDSTPTSQFVSANLDLRNDCPNLDKLNINMKSFAHHAAELLGSVTPSTPTTATASTSNAQHSSTHTIPSPVRLLNSYGLPEITDENTEENLKRINPAQIAIKISIKKAENCLLLAKLPSNITIVNITEQVVKAEEIINIVKALPTTVKSIYFNQDNIDSTATEIMLSMLIAKSIHTHHNAGGVEKVYMNKEWGVAKFITPNKPQVFIPDAQKGWVPFQHTIAMPSTTSQIAALLSQPPRATAKSVSPSTTVSPVPKRMYPPTIRSLAPKQQMVAHGPITALPPPFATSMVAPSATPSFIPPHYIPVEKLPNSNDWSLNFIVSPAMPTTKEEFRKIYNETVLTSERKIVSIQFIFSQTTQPPTAEVLAELATLSGVTSLVFNSDSNSDLNGDATWGQAIKTFPSLASLNFQTLPTKEFLQHLCVNSKLIYRISAGGRIKVNSKEFIAFIQTSLPTNFNRFSIGPKVEEALFNVLLCGRHNLSYITFDDTTAIKNFKLEPKELPPNLNGLQFNSPNSASAFVSANLELANVYSPLKNLFINGETFAVHAARLSPNMPLSSTSAAPATTRPLQPFNHYINRIPNLDLDVWSLTFFISSSMPKTKEEFRALYNEEILGNNKKIVTLQFILSEGNQTPTEDVIAELKTFKDVKTIMFHSYSTHLNGDASWGPVLRSWPTFEFLIFQNLPTKEFFQHVYVNPNCIYRIGSYGNIKVNSEEFETFIQTKLPQDFKILSIGPKVEEKLFHLLLSGNHSIHFLILENVTAIKNFKLKEGLAPKLTKLHFNSQESMNAFISANLELANVYPPLMNLCINDKTFAVHAAERLSNAPLPSPASVEPRSAQTSESTTGATSSTSQTGASLSSSQQIPPTTEALAHPATMADTPAASNDVDDADMNDANDQLDTLPIASSSATTSAAATSPSTEEIMEKLMNEYAFRLFPLQPIFTYATSLLSPHPDPHPLATYPELIHPGASRWDWQQSPAPLTPAAFFSPRHVAAIQRQPVRIEEIESEHRMDVQPK